MPKEILDKVKCVFIPCEANNYRPKILESRVLAYFVLAILFLKLLAVPFLILLPKNIFFADIAKNALVEMINTERQDFGLKTLKENPKLNEAAYLKAKDMIEKDYFSHQSPEGVTPWEWFKKAGYNYKFAGENLAIGFLDSKEVARAWMASPSHKQNIINSRYTETGIAVLRGDFRGNDAIVAVQFFGAPATRAIKNETPKEEKEGKPVSAEASVSAKATADKPAAEEETVASVLPQYEVQLASAENLTGKEVLVLSLTEFAVQEYNNWLQEIIYGLLFFIILSLLAAIFCDIFIYKRFQIQYKDLIFKALGFSLILLIFLYIDKEKIIQLIPHNFSI